MVEGPTEGDHSLVILDRHVMHDLIPVAQIIIPLLLGVGITQGMEFNVMYIVL